MPIRPENRKRYPANDDHTIEPDFDLRQWRELYELATETGKTLKTVIIERAFPPRVRVPDFEIENRKSWCERLLRGTWNSPRHD